MFRSTARNLRSWWGDFSEDILGADLASSVDDEEFPELEALDYHLTHAHRQPLRSSRLRREGAVAARPAHCLSPVRAQDPAVSAGPSSANHQLAG